MEHVIVQTLSSTKLSENISNNNKEWLNNIDRNNGNCNDINNKNGDNNEIDCTELRLSQILQNNQNKCLTATITPVTSKNVLNSNTINNNNNSSSIIILNNCNNNNNTTPSSTTSTVTTTITTISSSASTTPPPSPTILIRDKEKEAAASAVLSKKPANLLMPSSLSPPTSVIAFASNQTLTATPTAATVAVITFPEKKNFLYFLRAIFNHCKVNKKIIKILNFQTEQKNSLIIIEIYMVLTIIIIVIYYLCLQLLYNYMFHLFTSFFFLIIKSKNPKFIFGRRQNKKNTKF